MISCRQPKRLGAEQDLRLGGNRASGGGTLVYFESVLKEAPGESRLLLFPKIGSRSEHQLRPEVGVSGFDLLALRYFRQAADVRQDGAAGLPQFPAMALVRSSCLPDVGEIIVENSHGEIKVRHTLRFGEPQKDRKPY